MFLEKPAPQQLDIWPENWLPFCVFLRLQNQWNCGMAGPIALDYSSLPLWLRIEAAPRSDWWQITADVQTMESHTLRLMREAKG